MSNSKEYYKKQKEKFVIKWKEQRKHRAVFAFKQTLKDSITYGIGFFIIHLIFGWFPEIDEFWKLSVIMTVLFFIIYILHYFLTFKMNEKSYLRTKRELEKA